ncbi:MAG: hypothetical protein O8C63_04230 [Candidatus Methanoperedens sp.]|nr:hypothetical protein [Candidatus Methanoperedens sp.]
MTSDINDKIIYRIMILTPFLNGIEETIGVHVILSNIFWWASLILVFTAYRSRKLWQVGDTPWTFLFLTFLFFGIRELGHLGSSSLIASVRYVFGIWSAIFMTSLFIYLYVLIYMRKTIPKIATCLPFVLALVFPLVMLFLFFAGIKPDDLKNIISSIENLVWIAGSSITILTTYMLGTRAAGGFVKVFMLFQIAAILALLWKFMALITSIGCTIPYSIRETLETLFGVFAIISVYVLTKMLKSLARTIR